MNHSQPTSLFNQLTKQVEKLTSKELLSSTKTAAKREQNETLFVLAHLYEIDRRRLYAQ